MKYFKDVSNKIFAYDDEQIKQGFGLGLTPITEVEKDEILKPTAEQLNEQRLSEIKARLIEIDGESIRPLRAIAAGTSSQFDTDKLTALETERASLAAKLAALNG